MRCLRLLAQVLRIALAVSQLLLSLVRRMAFRPPTFNLSANVWRWGNNIANPPDVITPCSLSPGRRTLAPVLLIPQATAAAETTLRTQTGIPMEGLFPARTDIRYGSDPGPGLDNPDLVEIPAGSQRYYVVVGVDDVGRGFSNEYRLAIMLPTTAFVLQTYANPWGAPTPFYPLP